MEKSLTRYLSRLGNNTRRIKENVIRQWHLWMRENGGGLSGYSLDELVEYQRREKGYEILDLVQEWILGKDDLRAGTLQMYYSTIRSFFAHNRAPLPQDPMFKVTGGRPPVQGRLRVEHIKRVIEVSNPMYRAFWLSVAQGFMGLHEAIQWSNTGLSQLQRSLDAGECPIRIDFPGGRKSNPNPFYTFIGDDAVEALRGYLEVRPSAGDSIFITRYGTPLSEATARTYWVNTLIRVGIVKPVSSVEERWQTIRYGYNVHEIRDVMRSRWRLSGLDPEVAEFFMGHRLSLDRYNYDKSPFHYPEWFRDQYIKALPWLNILSSDPDTVPREKYESTIEKQQLEINDLRYELLELKSMVRNLAEGEKIVEKKLED